MTKSGSHCKGKSQKFRKRSSNIDFNHLFSRIERFWAFPKKNFFGSFKKFKNRTSPKIKIKWVPDFSRIWNFQGMFLTILSTISKSFRKILGQKIYQKKFKVSKCTLWAHGEKCHILTRFFLDLKFSGMVPLIIIYHFWEF